MEVFPDGKVRGCEVEKLWSKSEIGDVKGKSTRLVDILKTQKAKDFMKIARNCTCTFECATAVNTMYTPSKLIKSLFRS